jgi:hypothetical protein
MDVPIAPFLTPAAEQRAGCDIVMNVSIAPFVTLAAERFAGGDITTNGTPHSALPIVQTTRPPRRPRHTVVGIPLYCNGSTSRISHLEVHFIQRRNRQSGTVSENFCLPTLSEVDLVRSSMGRVCVLGENTHAHRFPPPSIEGDIVIEIY